jgi:hypothetical protein
MSPAKFEFGCQVCKLGSQTQTWQMSWQELVEKIPRPKKSVDKLELGRPCAKFKFGCQVQNMADPLQKRRNLAGSNVTRVVL